MNRKYTFIIIPHSNTSSFRVQVTLRLLVLLFILGSTITLWAVLTVGRHINYWQCLKANKGLENRILASTRSIEKDYEYIEKIRELDDRVGEFLAMGQPLKDRMFGLGGPSIADQQNLESFLENKGILGSRLTLPDVSSLQKEAWEKEQHYRKIHSFIERKRSLSLATPSILPTTGWYVSGFGRRIHPITKRREFHKGIDIANKLNTPIRVTADGIVVFSGRRGTFGKVVIVKHGHGYSTVYAHCNRNLVQVGDKVKRGQIIALMGRTGLVTGSHLHYEVRYEKEPKNPIGYINAAGSSSRFPRKF